MAKSKMDTEKVITENIIEQENVIEESVEKNQDTQIVCEQTEVAVVEENADKESGEEKLENEFEQINEDGNAILKDLAEFARILGTTVKSLKEEIYLLQIRKIMAKLQKVVVRYDMTEAEMEKIFLTAGHYGLGGITVAPAYLPNCIRQNKKSNAGKLKISSIIDFPFGESSLKGKISDVKESIKMGASTVAVSIPSMKLNKENLKELKKESRKFCFASKKKAGIVLNASDINEENYVEAMKVLRKTKLAYIVLAFGDATIEEVKRKLSVITKLGVNKKLFVLANVEKVESVVEIFKLKVDSILSPYADDIGNDLLKRFNLIAK